MCDLNRRNFHHDGFGRKHSLARINRLAFLTGVLGCLAIISPAMAEPGVTDSVIRIGSTQPLTSDISLNAERIKNGMEAALKNQKVQGRSIELVVLNDSYEPSAAVKAAKQLIDQGIFLMLGSTGSPTAKAVLPVLAENKVPAVGFINAAGFTEPGDILNFRAPCAQEVTTVVEAALAAGVKPAEICAYVQNDSLGMAGLKGIRVALGKQAQTADLVATLDQIIAVGGDNPKRNNIGPVGVHQRETLSVSEGYLSLKAWEKKSGMPCRFVVTALTPLPAVQFISYAATLKGEKWAFSVVSPAVDKALIDGLNQYNVKSKVIATSVTPLADSGLPIVKEAQKALGPNFNLISLESYMVGKMFLMIANNIQGELTRANFLAAARAHPYDLGGVVVDYTKDNQGSDFVQLMSLQDGEFKAVGASELRKLFQ